MTSKERAFLIKEASRMTPIFQFGKMSITPEFTKGVSEALEARELIKIGVLKNCVDDPKELARVISERTGSQIVQVIGKKIVLYKPNKDLKKRKYFTGNDR
ncbi:MAG: YhbY family RNA-binding protein [Clostridiales bacterium]|nr:YhbY family RNA-binding protein [Clostridiales bacterium]MBS5877213.1 YhbY family RNA-binding protein [Clostridiales bacterium]MDU0938947.1 YhbY family RNA-binding protein [Clostridiales bacterium]MDU1041918.1 YhbY family RNA-binding protein [Clostridiales bacterium]MDU3490954.1 YhbY family RNA-binding protein [Clostridiales bacterium]